MLSVVDDIIFDNESCGDFINNLDYLSFQTLKILIGAEFPYVLSYGYVFVHCEYLSCTV